MTAPTYTQQQQQTPHLFGQTPGYDPFNPFGTSYQGFGGGLQTGFGGGLGSGLQTGFGQQQWSQQPWGQQPWSQQGGDVYTLVWQLLGYAHQSIQLAQQIVMQSIQQQQTYQTPFGPRNFQRQPMAW
ncbi:MAG TPA: hypothetical protein VFC19_26610 [Candidatus Limnocylindrales bacterium]|nr:hypothetical protein [Candidatus Limnocylindrales bacterium]